MFTGLWEAQEAGKNAFLGEGVSGGEKSLFL